MEFAAHRINGSKTGQSPGGGEEKDDSAWVGGLRGSLCLGVALCDCPNRQAAPS